MRLNSQVRSGSRYLPDSAFPLAGFDTGRMQSRKGPATTGIPNEATGGLSLEWTKLD